MLSSFPLLNGFSIPCLASQHASPATRAVFTNIFGGAEGNEGLGLLSVSFDWAYIGSEFMSLPLVQQGEIDGFGFTNVILTLIVANSWIGYVICYVAVAGIYYSNTWDVCDFGRDTMHMTRLMSFRSLNLCRC